jgi:hypothetical protein
LEGLDLVGPLTYPIIPTNQPQATVSCVRNRGLQEDVSDVAGVARVGSTLIVQGEKDGNQGKLKTNMVEILFRKRE